MVALAVTESRQHRHFRFCPAGWAVRGCAPESGAEKFRGGLAGFHARRLERVPLDRKFHLDRDYILLTPDEVAEFLNNARSGIAPGSELQEKYAGYPGIPYFSKVYFDTRQTAALVYRENWGSSLCAAGQWIYLEKRAEEWVPRSGEEPHP